MPSFPRGMAYWQRAGVKTGVLDILWLYGEKVMVSQRGWGYTSDAARKNIADILIWQ